MDIELFINPYLEPLSLADAGLFYICISLRTPRAY